MLVLFTQDQKAGLSGRLVQLSRWVCLLLSLMTWGIRMVPYASNRVRSNEAQSAQRKRTWAMSLLQVFHIGTQGLYTESEPEKFIELYSEFVEL